MKIIFEKRELRLKEDAENIDVTQDKGENNTTDAMKTATVKPLSAQNGSPNLASDLRAAKQKNPNAVHFAVNPSIYDKANRGTVVNATMKSSDFDSASKDLQNALNSDPKFAQATAHGDSTMNITVEGIVFTKGELNEFLKRL